MGSCCQKQSQYGDARNEEPSAWQLATMDDFYDSEASEMHDESHVVALHPSGMLTARSGPRNDDLNLQSDDEQFVSLDFNLAPKLAPAFRSSLLRSSSSSINTSVDRTEALVLPEIAALNDIRGSGSFTTLSASPTPTKPQSTIVSTSQPKTRPTDAPQRPEHGTDLDGTVIIHNSSSIYSSSYADSRTMDHLEKPLGGVLSGEDDEESVASPLVSFAPSTPSKSTTAASTPHTSSPNRASSTTADRGYVPLAEMDDSTVYEDAVSSESQMSVTT